MTTAPRALRWTLEGALCSAKDTQLDFSLLDSLCLCVCAHFLRVGEAAVPGRSAEDPSSFMDPPIWTLPGTPDFCLGLFPSVFVVQV